MHLSRINISCKRAIHRQIYAGSQSVGEVRNQQLSHSLMTGLQMDEHIARIALNQGATPQVKTYLTDALGSVIATAKADQSLEVGYAFSPYGQTQKAGVENQLAVSENSSQYTGRENDNNGLYFYRARYYDPVLKRFISEDPIGLAGGINSHGYVEGDPVSFTDPLGLERFIGEDRANEFLRKNGCNSEKAWDDVRQHRYTYRGLREQDRNAEHYLLARYKVEANSYNWGLYHAGTTGYHTWKFWSNALLREKSPFRGSPVSFDEMMSGHYGSNDGLWGSPCGCN